MHPRLPCARPWVAPLALLLAVVRCGDVAGPGGYTVTYRASLAGIATIDSIYYDNGSGECASNCTSDSTQQRVVAPTVPATNPSWVVVLSNVAPGSTLQVHLFATGTNAGTANLVRLWMTADGARAGASITAAAATWAQFTADLAARRL